MVDQTKIKRPSESLAMVAQNIQVHPALTLTKLERHSIFSLGNTEQVYLVGRNYTQSKTQRQYIDFG